VWWLLGLACEALEFAHQVWSKIFDSGQWF
jgi:hypothetical protein